MEIVAAHLIQLQKKEVEYGVLLKEDGKMSVKNVVVRYKNLLDTNITGDCIEYYKIHDIETKQPLSDYLNMMMDSVFEEVGLFADLDYAGMSLDIDFNENDISDEEIKYINLLVYVLGASEPHISYVYPGWSVGGGSGNNIVEGHAYATAYVNMKQGYSDVVDLIEKAKDTVKRDKKAVVLMTDKYCVRYRRMYPNDGFFPLQMVERI